MEAATILLGCADLFFASRIETTARQLGFRVERLPAAPTDDAPPSSVLAIVDLDDRGEPLAWIRRLRAQGEGYPIVAFVRHDESERIRQGREAGASRILSRGAFSQKLPDLLQAAAGDSMGA